MNRDLQRFTGAPTPTVASTFHIQVEAVLEGVSILYLRDTIRLPAKGLRPSAHPIFQQSARAFSLG